ncbi:GNAT family N-acetyltransferase [Aquisphaera insulae]|uniref:GNAT family N-acetyltransferase n=1 Tax=Aquisphaera insulae TaxID=2712864 RepID=UPI0013EC8298|nr:GNAT family N-acetyltransferase [Aquisphaera insulae]
MEIDVTRVSGDEVRALRDLHRREMDCQIILDSWLGRGWADPYLLRLDGRVAGYGLAGGIREQPRELVIEFYVLPDHRAGALPLFRRFVEVSGAKSVEAQSNDLLLTLMLYDAAEAIESPVILFQDATTTGLAVPGAACREATEADRDRLAAHGLDTDAGWVVEVGGGEGEGEGEIVAAGGLLFHYNVPYGDIYMAVADAHRRRGYGSFLVQELKRACYEMGRIPSARCNATNVASRATLQKAGMLPCARVLTGTLRGTGAVS